MERGKVYYIQVKPYTHQLSVQTLLDRFVQSDALRRSTSASGPELRAKVAHFMQRFTAAHVPKDPVEQEIDRIISKKIMEHLIEFFKGSKGAKKMKDARLGGTQKRHSEAIIRTKTMKIISKR
jgi:hypothetical protein